MFKNFKVITLKGTRRGVSGDMRHRTQALETNQHTLFRLLKITFFSKSQNMPNKAYFLEKRLLKLPQRPEADESPLDPSGWGLRLQGPLSFYSHLPM